MPIFVFVCKWNIFYLCFLSHNQIANTKQVCAETFDNKGDVQEEPTVHLLILRKSLKSEFQALLKIFSLIPSSYPRTLKMVSKVYLFILKDSLIA